MNTKITWSQRLSISSMLFGLLFGAGNLIFPIFMGQQAGSAVWQTNWGFLLAGIGLPFLGILAMGLTYSSNVQELAAHVGKTFSIVYTLGLYLIIGPLFAIPRLASTSFEIGISPFLSDSHQQIGLVLFSIFFFSLSWFFSRKPSKILMTVGRFLNPLFLILLSVIMISVFLNPMGSISQTQPQALYQANPLFQGFLDGYNTLDALAAIAFGAIIIQNLNRLGIQSGKDIAKECFKSGSLAMILMGIIYTLLAVSGAMSQNGLAFASNGGVILTQLTAYYLGTFGKIVLALLVFTACLKTAIGLMTSFAQAISDLYPRWVYARLVLWVAALSAIIATLGLTRMLALFQPVLLIVYPVTIVLIVLSILRAFYHFEAAVMYLPLGLTLLSSVLDAICLLPPQYLQGTLIGRSLLAIRLALPFGSIDFGWVTAAIIGGIVSFLYFNYVNHSTIKANK